mgnify:CR=1 FL=1
MKEKSISKVDGGTYVKNSQRTPLILLILKLPFLLTTLLVTTLGCVPFSPFYFYLRIFQVTFNPKQHN